MNKHIILATLALPLALSSAFAQESSSPTVKISGFGTGALTWTNTDQAEFGRPNQAAGARKTPRTGVDSNLGLQVDVGINSWLSFTGQGLVRKDAVDDYGAELAWAFAKAKINDEFSVRVGRVGMPTFMISDYRNVGYANNFLRAPGEMYSQVPYNNLDGIDATWQHSFGDTSVTAQLGYGQTEAQIAGGLTGKGKHVATLNLVAEHGPFTFRYGHLQADITLSGSTRFESLLAGLRVASARLPQLGTMAAELEAKGKRATFDSFGMTMDWNNIVAQGEYAKRKTNSYVNDTTSWYLMGGYRIGKFLPYAIHSKLSIDRFPANVVPAGVPALAPLRAGASILPYYGLGQGEQSTTSIGMRWDFHSSLALKAQIDRIKPDVGYGLLLNPAPGFAQPVTVGAVALDFVF